MLQRVGTSWRPPPKISTRAWLREHFRLPAEAGDGEGRYNPDKVPALWGLMAALDDDDVRVVIAMKAAQIGWTMLLVGFLGKRIHTQPSGIVALFAKDGDARDFNDEKFSPAVLSTPVLNQLMDVSTSRKNGNRVTRKRFPGGFLKLVGSNSTGGVKSTPAGLVVVEEPDDTSENVKKQGDAIRLVKERLKRQRDGKLVLGGTPSVAGLSRVEEQTNLGTQRVLPITCHDCGEQHVLDWENVYWADRDEGTPHPVYGMADPDSAVYSCPHCGSAWDDWRRQQNIYDTVSQAEASGDAYCGWVPTVDRETVGGVESFKELGELYVCLEGTSLADVVRDYLEAEHDAERGDESGRVVFVNSKLGRPYAYRSDAPEREALEARALAYPELQVPDGGLVLTAGVDVQHDRIAVLIDAWGRDEESWTIYFGELHGNTMLRQDPVWDGLDKLLFQTFASATGLQLRISAISIDASDGTTSDAVYAWVRDHQRTRSVQVMAIKGGSQDYGSLEIFSRPKPSIDTKGRRHTKAHRYGLTPYIVGTHKAKDLLAGRMKLEGHGPGRWHWYEEIRPDFYDQVLGEVKAPHRSIRGKKVWQQKAGQPIEAWDCKVYALHASRAAKVHLMKPAQWDSLEAFLKQRDLFGDGQAPAQQAEQSANKQPKNRAQQVASAMLKSARRRSGG
jgi:phage terminase large subunit GpA-like protein